MKLMHSLPQQISITHTNGPHLRRRCKKENNMQEKGSINNNDNKRLENKMNIELELV